MKIAILGTSPIMLMIANILSKKNQVTIFDYSRNIGGAWSYYKYKTFFVPKYSNAVVPLNNKELKFIPKMNFFLRSIFNIPIKNTNKKIFIKLNLKKKYIYKFNNLYNKNIQIIKKNIFVRYVEINKENNILINKKFIFDRFYIPTYAGISRIRIKDKYYKIPFSIKISKHLSIIAKKTKLKNFYYSDFFNEYFDRVKLDKYKNFYGLTTRITKSKKKLSFINIKKQLKVFLDQKDLIYIKRSKFINFYRDDKQIKILKKIVKSTNIRYVNTVQLVSGLFNLKNFIDNNI